MTGVLCSKSLRRLLLSDNEECIGTGHFMSGRWVDNSVRLYDVGPRDNRPRETSVTLPACVQGRLPSLMTAL